MLKKTNQLGVFVISLFYVFSLCSREKETDLWRIWARRWRSAPSNCCVHLDVDQDLKLSGKVYIMENLESSPSILRKLGILILALVLDIRVWS